jgi:hypothetical protein
MAMTENGRSEQEAGVAREAKVLKRLLATPPDHTTKPKPGASPKKRRIYGDMILIP